MTPAECAGFAAELDLRTVGKSVIYFLFDGTELVYIGQSTAFMQRVHAHTVNPHNAMFNRGHRFDRVFYVVVEREDVDAAEGAFIRFCRPRNNGTIPKSTGRDVEMLRRYASAMLGGRE